MQSTYQNLKELANLHTGSTDISYLAFDYQMQEEPIIFSYVFCQLFPYTLTQVDKYFNITESDKASYAMEELHRALLDYDPRKGAELQTLYSRYLNNRLRAETQMSGRQKRKVNNGADCYEEVAVTLSGYYDDKYDTIEMAEMLTKCSNLTDNEFKYCQIVMKEDPDSICDSDISKTLGITPAAVNYIKKSLRKKLVIALA